MKPFHFPRFGLAVLATFFVSFVVFTASFLILPLDMNAWQAEHGRVDGDALRNWGLVGHFLQAAALSLIYFALIRSTNHATGILYGLMMGVYLSATDLTILAAFAAASERFTYLMIPANMVAGMISGWVLAMLYRPRT